jgi:hypothetical protein
MLTWSGDTLPILAEWRSMASGDYVLGLEPSNTCIMGRSVQRGQGPLPVIEPYASIHTHLAFHFCTMKEEEE